MNWQTDGSQAGVQNAVASANAGDSVLVPAGTFTWAGTLTINKSISLTGAGQSQTIIQSNNGTSDMIDVISGADGHIVVSGIYFKQLVNPTQGRSFMLMASRDDTRPYTVMVHDCTFDCNTIYGYSLLCASNGILIWNCTFIGSGFNGVGGISMVCQKYGDGTKTGKGAWNSPSTMGTLDTDGLNNTYVEDCTFSQAPTGVVNADDNSRVVIRHCVVQDSDLHAHGQDTSIYGVRHYEIYNNTFKNVNAANLNLNSWTYIRGGVFVIANNVVDAPPVSKPSFILITQSINRSDAIPCQTVYPAARQIGQGWSGGSSAQYGNPVVPSDGVGAILDPCYIWGNTGAGGDGFASQVAVVTYIPDDCGHGLVGAMFLQQNRDYYVGTPRPGWAPYAYPHPLRQQVKAVLITTLTALQASAVAIIGADGYFTGAASVNGKPVPIVTEKKGDILSQIQICLGSVGVCALVMTPLFEFHNNLIPDLNGWAFLTVTLYEDPVVNQSAQGTGIFAIALAERVLCVMHFAPHGVLTGKMAGDPATFLGIPKPIEMISEGPPLQYNVSFQAHVQLNQIYQ